MDLKPKWPGSESVRWSIWTSSSHVLRPTVTLNVLLYTAACSPESPQMFPSSHFIHVNISLCTDLRQPFLYNKTSSRKTEATGAAGEHAEARSSCRTDVLLTKQLETHSCLPQIYHSVLTFYHFILNRLLSQNLQPSRSWLICYSNTKCPQKCPSQSPIDTKCWSYLTYRYIWTLKHPNV